MGGQGKTTLAWNIYNHAIRSEMFTKYIWVRVTKRFNIQDVFAQIMKQISASEHGESNRGVHYLSHTVQECLEGEKFLLVLDDVWETKHWDAIRCALPTSNRSSKVLVTSRHKNIGRYVERFTEPHELKPLDDNEGWDLLQLAVFGDHKKCPSDLYGPGRKIAMKCEGMPLVISLIGGALKEHYGKYKSLPQKVKEKWEKTASNVSNELGDKLQHVVKRSYDGLPDHLKECFLYLGVFPEGYEIPTWTLKCLWIAEGFIEPHEEKSFEETAEDNLNDLINRNLLIPLKTNSMQEVKVCVVHNMVRMYCRYEGWGQNLFRVSIMKEKEVPYKLESEMDRIRRLCLHSNVPTFFSSKLPGPRVRSFLSFQEKVMKLEPEHNDVISETFHLLRILQFKSFKFNEFPKSVIKLKHLRYIVLWVDNLRVLPESISQLWNLQTVIVYTNSDSIKMEANIWKMVQLRHVETKAAIVLEEKWKAAARNNIQVLNRLSPESITADFSQKASSLKTLGIQGDLSVVFDNMSLEKLRDLEKLKLYHAVTNNQVQSIPKENHFPRNLKRLTLSNTSLNWEHMNTIAGMLHLEVLKLKNKAFTGSTWDADKCVYKKLQFLLIVNTDLIVWKAPADAFPCLTRLVLKDCKALILDQISDYILQRIDRSESQLESNFKFQLDRILTADSVWNSTAQF